MHTIILVTVIRSSSPNNRFSYCVGGACAYRDRESAVTSREDVFVVLAPMQHLGHRQTVTALSMTAKDSNFR